ncbi:MAG: MOSC domain-containing protein [Candidatus Heimdallarchaeaceae archaeon]
MTGIIKAVNISERKGIPKKNIETCKVTEKGLLNDAHSGDWHRQVSLLAEESIEKMRKMGLDLKYGAFAENLTTKGITLYELPIGTRLRINDVILEVTQIGKKCHDDCAIKQQVGKCIMPKEGIFAKVIQPGTISVNDKIEIIES